MYVCTRSISLGKRTATLAKSLQNQRGIPRRAREGALLLPPQSAFGLTQTGILGGHHQVQVGAKQRPAKRPRGQGGGSGHVARHLPGHAHDAQVGLGATLTALRVATAPPPPLTIPPRPEYVTGTGHKREGGLDSAQSTVT